MTMGRLTNKVALISGMARGRAARTRCGWSPRARRSSASRALHLRHRPVQAGNSGRPGRDGPADRGGGRQGLRRRARTYASAARSSGSSRQGTAEIGPVDIVIANAGIGINSRPFWEISQQEWDDVIGVCLTGVWNTVSAAVPAMIEAGNGGSVIMTSSAAAIKAAPQLSAYTAAKTGVVGMMRSMASDLAPHRIRINCVAPTAVPTDFVLNDRLYQIFSPDSARAEPRGRQEGHAGDAPPRRAVDRTRKTSRPPSPT